MGGDTGSSSENEGTEQLSRIGKNASKRKSYMQIYSESTSVAYADRRKRYEGGGPSDGDNGPRRDKKSRIERDNNLQSNLMDIDERQSRQIQDDREKQMKFRGLLKKAIEHRDNPTVLSGLQLKNLTQGVRKWAREVYEKHRESIDDSSNKDLEGIINKVQRANNSYKSAYQNKYNKFSNETYNEKEVSKVLSLAINTVDKVVDYAKYAIRKQKDAGKEPDSDLTQFVQFADSISYPACQERFFNYLFHPKSLSTIKLHDMIDKLSQQMYELATETAKYVRHNYSDLSVEWGNKFKKLSANATESRSALDETWTKIITEESPERCNKNQVAKALRCFNTFQQSFLAVVKHILEVQGDSPNPELAQFVGQAKNENAYHKAYQEKFQAYRSALIYSCETTHIDAGTLLDVTTEVRKRTVDIDEKMNQYLKQYDREDKEIDLIERRTRKHFNSYKKAFKDLRGDFSNNYNQIDWLRNEHTSQQTAYLFSELHMYQRDVFIKAARMLVLDAEDKSGPQLDESLKSELIQFIKDVKDAAFNCEYSYDYYPKGSKSTTVPPIKVTTMEVWDKSDPHIPKLEEVSNPDHENKEYAIYYQNRTRNLWASQSIDIEGALDAIVKEVKDITPTSKEELHRSLLRVGRPEYERRLSEKGHWTFISKVPLPEERTIYSPGGTAHQVSYHQSQASHEELTRNRIKTDTSDPTISRPGFAALVQAGYYAKIGYPSAERGQVKLWSRKTSEDLMLEREVKVVWEVIEYYNALVSRGLLKRK